MNTRGFIKLSVFTITVLLADLLKESIIKFLPVYHSVNPYKLTAVSMLLSVLIFVPAFAFLDKYIKATATHYVKKSKVIPLKRRLMSVFLSLLLALALLYSGFLFIRYNISLLDNFKKIIS